MADTVNITRTDLFGNEYVEMSAKFLNELMIMTNVPSVGDTSEIENNILSAVKRYKKDSSASNWSRWPEGMGQ